MRSVLTVILVTSFLASSSQSWKDVIASTRSYYSNKISGTVEVNSSFKSILKSDTNFSTRVFIFHKDTVQIAKLIPYQGSNYILLKGNLTYDVNPENQTFYQYKDESSAREFVLYWRPHDFLKEFLSYAKWTSIQLQQTPQYYILNYSTNRIRNTILEIEKQTFRIASYTDVIQNKRYGVQFKKYEFKHLADSTTPDSLLRNLADVTSSYNEITDLTFQRQYDDYEKKKKALIGQKLDKTKLLDIVYTDFQMKHADKYILLDFFGQGCLPCIKAIPELIALDRNYNDNLAVVGVDFSINDIGHTEKFIKRYNITYPVVDGEKSISVKKLIPDLMVLFPTMVLIAPDGAIVAIMDGYSKKHYKWLESFFDK